MTTASRAETAITAVGILVTSLGGIMAMADLVRVGRALGSGSPATLLQLWAFGLIVAGLIYGGLVYQFCRLGYFSRLSRHTETARTDLERIYDGPAKPLTVLIPSYKEELNVLAQ